MHRLPLSRLFAPVVSVLLIASLCASARLSARAAEVGEPVGQVLPPELRDAAVSIRRARLEEGLALVDLKNLLDDTDPMGDAYSNALAHVRASIADLDAALDALDGLRTGPMGGAYPPSFFAGAATRIDRIREIDTDALDGLDVLAHNREARRAIRRLEDAIGLKDTAAVYVLSAREDQPLPPIRRRARRNSPDEPYVPVALRSPHGFQMTFDTTRDGDTGVVPEEQQDAVALTVPNRVPAGTLRTGPGHMFKRAGTTNRFLAFRGRKKRSDGLAFHVLPHALYGPYEVEFSAGLFRKARKKHSPDARLSVEFDVRGDGPLDFFVVSTRYVPADAGAQTPAGVQVFCGSTGGVARGDLFLPGAVAADVRVVFENGRFDVVARPLGGAEEDYAAVGSFQHGDAGEAWTLGVGASRLRKGTELGIDDLVLTPR